MNISFTRLLKQKNMDKNTNLSNEEIYNLKIKFRELYVLFERDKVAFSLFKKAPVSFLRLFGVDVMKYIKNQFGQFNVASLSLTIRRMLKFTNMFNRCSWCKTFTLVAIYALCGKARIAIDAFWTLIAGVMEAIEKIADMSSETTKNVLKKLDRINQRVSPFRFAEAICEQLGYCP